MLYFLKLAASFLLPPGIFIAMLLLVVFLLKKRREYVHKGLCLIIALFYIFSTGYVGSYLLRTLEARHVPPTGVSGDVIIMLGGGATLDTPDIDGPGHLSGSAANRLLTAARLQRKLGVPVIISGGQVFEDSGREAVIARRILLGLGIPEEQILVEDTSLNTTQNAMNVKKILGERGFWQPILVTSAFHMERSILNFAKQGVRAQAYPADYLVSTTPGLYANNFVPSADGLRNSAIFFREWLGIWALRLRQ
ncbi:MAG: YdcF family protein [Veillonellales bacterium]